MSDARTAPGLDPEVMWTPDAERIESANVTRLMRKAGMRAALGKDPGDLSTLEDEGALEALRAGLAD